MIDLYQVFLLVKCLASLEIPTMVIRTRSLSFLCCKKPNFSNGDEMVILRIIQGNVWNSAHSLYKKEPSIIFCINFIFMTIIQHPSASCTCIPEKLSQEVGPPFLLQANVFKRWATLTNWLFPEVGLPFIMGADNFQRWAPLLHWKLMFSKCGPPFQADYFQRGGPHL